MNKLKKQKRSMFSFTLTELLVTIAIIGILSVIIFFSVQGARERSYMARVKSEMRNIETALVLYSEKYGGYPADADRSIPPGLEEFLAGGIFPSAPWPGSIYDWDNWINPDDGVSHIFQISVRFCPISGPLSACHFPRESWASGFDIDSSVYHCIYGSCRSHVSHPTTYPGYCLNCD
ncbi:MAG: type II secretion system protein [Candidatus Paceibacterota bacterium]|jgi:prepilin-type N-terminal cleavage/methylation domain-containing protein